MKSDESPAGLTSCFHDDLSTNVVFLRQVLNKDEQELAAKNEYNFDHPDAFDFELLVSVLRKLKKGKSIKVPVYDFTSHCRRKEWVRRSITLRLSERVPSPCGPWLWTSGARPASVRAEWITVSAAATNHCRPPGTCQLMPADTPAANVLILKDLVLRI